MRGILLSVYPHIESLTPENDKLSLYKKLFSYTLYFTITQNVIIIVIIIIIECLGSVVEWGAIIIDKYMPYTKAKVKKKPAT